MTKHSRNTVLARLSMLSACSALAIACLGYALEAGATAPRISAQIFGEEAKAEIVGYKLVSEHGSAAKDHDKLIVEIVREAFGAAGATPAIDVLPSRQLAKYALTNNDAKSFFGSQDDFTAAEMRQYLVVTFFLNDIASAQKPVVMVFAKKSGKDLHKAFVKGLQAMLKNGKYQALLEKHVGSGGVPGNYIERLKRHNAGWK